MIKQVKEPILLNLVETLKSETINFFLEIGIKIVTKEEIDELSIDYILIEDEAQLQEIEIRFDILKKNIFVICLGQITDYKRFLLSNGRLAIKEEMLEDETYRILLSHYFRKISSVHLSDLFPNFFEEFHQFDISEHASIGQLTDEVSSIALNRKFNPVVLRTFIDHLIYYLTYLRQSGLAHAPFEFECGVKEKTFVLEVHVAMRNFVAEYLMDSFGSINSHDPLQFLLSIVQKSCHFLHINYVESTGKLIFLGVWQKDVSQVSGNIAFQNILSTEQTLTILDDKIHKYKEIDIDQEMINSDKLPGSIIEMVISPDKDSFLGKNEKDASDLVAYVIGRFEEVYPHASLQQEDDEKLREILKSYPNQEVLAQLKVSDEDHLISRIKKKHITEAYHEEIERVRDNFSNDEEFIKKLNDTFTENTIQKIEGSFDADVINRILGQKDQPEEIIHIEGSKDASEFVQKIKEVAAQKDDFVTRFSKTFEERSTIFDFDKIEKEKKKDVLEQILNDSSSRYCRNFKVDPKIQVYLSQRMPSHLEKSLEAFSKRIGKNLENFNNEDLNLFRQVELPKILNNALSEEEIKSFEKKLLKEIDTKVKSTNKNRSFSSELESRFRDALTKNLERIDDYNTRESFNFTEQDIQKDSVKTVIKNSLKEVLTPELQLKSNSKEELLQKEQVLIKELANLLPEKKEIVAKSINEAGNAVRQEELQKVLDNLFIEQKQRESETYQTRAKSMAESELVKKLKKAQTENKRLLNELQALKISKDAESLVNEKASHIDQEVRKQTDLEIEKVKPTSSAPQTEMSPEKLKLIADLEEGRKITDNQQEIIKDLLEKEKMIFQKEKEAEIILRKSQIENAQKETLFKRELERATKIANSKDLILQKAKESMKALVSKKELEIQGLNKRLQDLQKKMADDKSTMMEKEILSLRKENENMARMTEVYKNKLSSMAQSVMKNNRKDDSANLEAKNRALSRLKTQLENNLNTQLRKNKIAEEKLLNSKKLEYELRSEVKKLTDTVRELNLSSNAKQVENQKNEKSIDEKEMRKLQLLNTTLNAKNRELEERLKEMVAKSANEQNALNLGQQNSSAKEKQLESQTKKLNSELSKAKGLIATEKKNFVKLKAENTALKNQISRLKKDLAKLESLNKQKKAA